MNRIAFLSYNLSLKLAISWQSLVYSVHNSLLHLSSNFQNAIAPQNIAENCNNALFNAFWRTLFLAKSARTLTHFIFTMNVRNNYGFQSLPALNV